METVEIVIYITVALIVGGLMIGLVAGWDYQGLISTLTKKSNPDIEFEKVNHLQFVGKTIEFWDSCGFGAVDKSLTLFIEETGTIDEDDFFLMVKKLNKCNSLQSLSNDCGTDEHIDPAFSSITSPRVVRLECDSVARKLRILQ